MMVVVASVGPHSRLITTGLCSCSGVWDGHRESLVHPGLGNVAVSHQESTNDDDNYTEYMRLDFESLTRRSR